MSLLAVGFGSAGSGIVPPTAISSFRNARPTKPLATMDRTHAVRMRPAMVSCSMSRPLRQQRQDHDGAHDAQRQINDGGE